MIIQIITNLRAKTGLGTPQHSLKPLSTLDCDRYRDASRPGTYSITTLGIKGLFCTQKERGTDETVLASNKDTNHWKIDGDHPKATKHIHIN